MNRNDQQRIAVESPARWNLIIAGPGSGKSKVLIDRAAKLVADGRSAAEMCFVTFTNIGANVMRKRLKDAVGQVGFVGTLHGMMLGLLRRQDSRWTLIDEEDATEFILRQAKLLGFKGSVERLAKARVDGTDQSAVRVIMAYETFMRRERLLDYSTVLTEGLKIFQADPKANPWPIWFCDEFQDAADVDAAIYRAANPTDLMVVADSDQSIFGFRGARPENVTKFMKSGDFAVHTLELNYRCASKICTVANTVIQKNPNRIDKRTVSATEQEGWVEATWHPDDDTELAAVTAEVANRIHLGTPPQEIAVLCRTNKLAADFRNALTRKGVSVAHTESGARPKDWNLLHLILSMIGSPDSWPVARLLAREQAKVMKKETPEAAEKRVEKDRVEFPAAPPASRWGFPAAEVILSGNAYLYRYGVGAAAHNLLSQRIRLYEPRTLQELIEALRENPEARHTKGVNVMTAHGSKGEEFNTVFIPGADLFRTLDAKDMVQERNLFFVAVTRARQVLVVSGAAQRKWTSPSGRYGVRESVPEELFNAVKQWAPAAVMAE